MDKLEKYYNEYYYMFYWEHSNILFDSLSSAQKKAINNTLHYQVWKLNFNGKELGKLISKKIFGRLFYRR